MASLSRWLVVPVLALAIVTASPGTARAQARGVGLGVGAGLVVPSGDIKFDPGFNWGFFVDIPLIYSFHITPSTTIYRLSVGDQGAMTSGSGGAWITDTSLNFKFIIPIGPLSLFFGGMGGLTTGEKLNVHVGALAGGSFNLISNLEFFVQANYKFVLRDQDEGGNLKNLQIYAGPLFRFM